MKPQISAPQLYRQLRSCVDRFFDPNMEFEKFKYKVVLKIGNEQKLFMRIRKLGDLIFFKAHHPHGDVFSGYFQEGGNLLQVGITRKEPTGIITYLTLKEVFQKSKQEVLTFLEQA